MNEENEAETIARHRRDAQADRERLVAEVGAHPPTSECPDAECDLCGFRDCPHKSPDHYLKDGCTACYAGPEVELEIAACSTAALPRPVQQPST